MADFWESSREERWWFPCFSGSFNDWELEEVQGFLQVIQGKRISTNQKDLLLMRESKDGQLLMKLCYMLWFKLVFLVPLSLCMETLRSPPRLVFFAWEAS